MKTTEQGLRETLAAWMADPRNSELVGKVKLYMAELGSGEQGLVRSVSSLISMPSEMKWKEQRETVLETALKAIESMAQSEEKGWFSLFRRKEDPAAGQAELEEVIRELSRFRDSMKNDRVTLQFELDGIEKQIVLQEETLAVLAETKSAIASIQENMTKNDFNALMELLERKHNSFSAGRLATLQTKAALELLLKNNALLLDNLNNILSVLPDISQLGLIASRLRSGDASEISRYRNNLKQAIRSFN